MLAAKTTDNGGYEQGMGGGQTNKHQYQLQMFNDECLESEYRDQSSRLEFLMFHFFIIDWYLQNPLYWRQFLMQNE